MSISSSSRFRVLHAMRVKGLASGEAVAMFSGLAPDELARELAALTEDNLVLRREGRFAGYMLTPAGRQAHLPLLLVDVAAQATQAALSEAYDGFLPLNGEFKRICAAWQTSEPTGLPNDHSDGAYDRVIIERLADAHKRVVAVLAPLAAALGRFELYPSRLEGALGRIRSGDTAAFARPMADSYHEIWMELHQDLLLSLQRERSALDEGLA
ncbi:DNA-binding HxlR family transcriptional regulator [Streptomyces sp. V4I8]|uniref:hypothetical protein n=1 Tax=Streptomyces sp. V4I8 TaxID=3156469 RepID=UPI0035173C00